MAEPLVVGQGALLVPYSSTLDVPYNLAEYVSWLIHARRQELKSPWRRLGCSQQALLVLEHLRKNETFAQVGAGFGVSESTAWRYVDEILKVLAAWPRACARPWSGRVKAASSSLTAP
ncbi:hypothetical protein GO001_12855 [Streptomyces sp. NRRL B-1677]|nr:hypothetical protein [Streptomyces sp. NRRL B-1677]